MPRLPSNGLESAAALLVKSYRGRLWVAWQAFAARGACPQLLPKSHVPHFWWIRSEWG